MTIHDLLKKSQKKLQKSPCHTAAARLDAEVLLAHVLHRDRTWLVAHPEHEATKDQMRRFRLLVNRRAWHEPVAYLVGHKEFYGLDFKVNRAVLIPRPETELLVNLVLQKVREIQDTRYKIRILDLGTGSGAIAIALARALPHAQIIATDVSAAALRVARENAKKLGVQKRLMFRVGAGFLPAMLRKARQAGSLRWARRGIKPRPTTNQRLVVVANLPYLTTTQWRATAPEVKNYEPRMALLGGKDGLTHYRALFKRLVSIFHDREKYALTVFCEIDPSQKQKIARLARAIFPRAAISFHPDLAGKTRVCEITLP